jgi:DMSO/TMAO reductase YedYZ molybdopterin-dependent catalytic subunit
MPPIISRGFRGRRRDDVPPGRVTAADEPGFGEVNGYHNYGDPWREQRYWGD